MEGVLAGASNRLSEREKIVITLYYEGLTLAEIGQVLGVTESRVYQMHTKAVLQLRAKMRDARQSRTPATSRPVREAFRRGRGWVVRMVVHILVQSSPPAGAAG